MVGDNFISPWPLKTPVLFLIFKRLDTTKKVFDQIRKAKPPKLYIAADGPRKNISGELVKVNQVREYVLNNIDWNCQVKTLFRENNLGCGKAVSEAITWFFENEEMGIILEDDTVPSDSFFWFCEILLDKYKNNLNLWHISGSNFQNGIKRGEADYYFSIITHIWGWATWANRWKFYDLNINSLNNDRFLKDLLNDRFYKYWQNIFWEMKRFKIDTWDYQWLFTMWYNNALAINPNKNLVSNIGSGPDATHTKKENYKSSTSEISIENIIHPEIIERNLEADEYTFINHFGITPFYIKVINKLKNILK